MQAYMGGLHAHWNLLCWRQGGRLPINQSAGIWVDVSLGQNRISHANKNLQTI